MALDIFRHDFPAQIAELVTGVGCLFHLGDLIQPQPVFCRDAKFHPRVHLQGLLFLVSHSFHQLVQYALAVGPFDRLTLSSLDQYETDFGQDQPLPDPPHPPSTPC